MHWSAALAVFLAGVAPVFEIMIWSGDKTKLIHKKTFLQDYDYEL